MNNAEFVCASEAGRDLNRDVQSFSELQAVVFNLLKGKGVKEIAAELNLKSTTVATYKARIFDKMGVTNILELHQLSQLFHFAE